MGNESIASFPDQSKEAQNSALQRLHFLDVEGKTNFCVPGSNVQEVFMPLEVSKGKPIAVKSFIGLSDLDGSRDVQSSDCLRVNVISGEEAPLKNKLGEFWKVESYITTETEAKPLSLEVKAP